MACWCIADLGIQLQVFQAPDAKPAAELRTIITIEALQSRVEALASMIPQQLQTKPKLAPSQPQGTFESQLSSAKAFIRRSNKKWPLERLGPARTLSSSLAQSTKPPCAAYINGVRPANTQTPTPPPHH